ncbi:MAG: hypothetical protein GY953_03535, partial [bacterium]|nr:hypothetical protein [bacterium]
MTSDIRSPILSRLTHPAALSLILLAVNAWICRELFVVEYTRHLDSIAGAYVGLARWIAEHPTEWSWFPLWYGGIPFQNAYPPLLHFLTAGVALLSGASPALAHNVVTAVMYSLGPVTLFWFAWRVSGDRAVSFFAGLFYSVVAPSALLIPEIAGDMGTAFGSRRLHALVRYGEGPHIAAMTLLPVALLALHWALGKRRPLPVYGAALALAAVVLTNWLGAFALAAAVAALLLARDDGIEWRTLLTAAGIGVLAYAIAAPWVPPSTIADIRHNAQHVVGHFPMGWVQVAGLLLLAGAALGTALVLRRLGVGALERFAAVFVIPMAGITLMAHWLGVHVMPQPHRYHLEMDMALALAVAFAVGPLCTRLSGPPKTVAVGICLLLALPPFVVHRRFARELIEPIDIHNSLQYQSATWLHENLPGARVFIQGSSRFWMNAFADNPQLGGGFDQGITNP